MSDKVVISFKIEQELRDAIRKFAENENRAVSNFIESILLREKARLEGYTVTLESLDEKLDRLLDEQQEILANTKVAAKKKADTVKKNANRQEELRQIFELELPVTLSLERWKEWVIFQQGKKNYLTVKLADELLDRWLEVKKSTGGNLDEMVGRAMQSNYKDIVYNENAVKNRKKEYWEGAK